MRRTWFCSGVACAAVAPWFAIWGVPRARPFSANTTALQREWQEFVANASAVSAVSSDRRAAQGGRGVVTVGGRCHSSAHGVGATLRGCSDYTLDALLLLTSLRSAGCRLAVELWHDHDPRLLGGEGAAATEALSSVGGSVRLRDASLLPLGSQLRGYQLLPLVLLHSDFQELLALDADNVLLGDPTSLFESPAYRSSGAVFWAGAWNYNLLSVLWQVAGREPQRVPALDNAQLLLNRAKHRLPLELTAYWNRQGPDVYYHMSNGDSDLFQFAWLALFAPYHVASSAVSFAGYVADDGAFCAHTWLHAHPDAPNQVLFAHRTLYRFSATLHDEDARWTAVKRGRAPRGHALSFFFPRNQHLGDTCLVLRSRSRCLCTKDGAAFFPCPDADSPFVVDAWANATLAKLASVEQSLLALRRELLFRQGESQEGREGQGGQQGMALRPQWWLHLARHVAEAKT